MNRGEWEKLPTYKWWMAMNNNEVEIARFKFDIWIFKSHEKNITVANIATNCYKNNVLRLQAKWVTESMTNKLISNGL